MKYSVTVGQENEKYNATGTKNTTLSEIISPITHSNMFVQTSSAADDVPKCRKQCAQTNSSQPISSV